MGNKGSKGAKKAKAGKGGKGGASGKISFEQAGAPLTVKRAECILEFKTTMERAGLFSANASFATVPSEDPLPMCIAQQGAGAGALLSIIPRMTFPTAAEQQEMTMAAMSGKPMNITTRQLLDVYFAATAETGNQAVETVCVLAPFSLSTDLKNSLFSLSADMTMHFAGTNAGAALTPHLQQGFSCNGMYFNITEASGSTSVGLKGAESHGGGSGYVSYVLQRAPGQETAPVEAIQATFLIETQFNMMGKATTTLPDIAGYLAQAGADGFRMCGTHISPQPAAPPQIGTMNPKMQIPFEMLLERRPSLGKKYRYMIVQHSLHLDIKIGGQMSLKGSLDPIIEEAAAAGWQLRGAIQLTVAGQELPYVLIFMADAM